MGVGEVLATPSHEPAEELIVFRMVDRRITEGRRKPRTLHLLRVSVHRRMVFCRSSHPSPPPARSSLSPSSHSHLVYSPWSNGNYGGTLSPSSLLLIEVAMRNHKPQDQDASKGRLSVSLLHRGSLGKAEVRVLNRLGVLCL